MHTVLAGDIGGTKTRLAIAEVSGSNVKLLAEESFPSRNFSSFDTLLAEFLSDKKVPVSAAFGIAGPVEGRSVDVTNLPWRIHADELTRKFVIERCTLMNDLEATACGLPALCESDFLVLQEGIADAIGNAAVIAPGTGLGEAGIFWDGKHHRPFATEGGHASFSPQGELEMDLLKHLQRRYGHVSWERVVSGEGLVNIYEFLRINHPDSSMRDAAAISRDALEGSDAICVETLDCFVKLLGSEAGNLALKVMSRTGLYIGGGIPPKILPILKNGAFLEAFLNKGRMRHLLEKMPVRVILEDRAALYGAALRAAEAL